MASETGSEDTCHGNVTARGAPGTHSPLSATKSFTYPDIETTASCSYFRSPKLNAKVSVSTQFLKVRHLSPHSRLARVRAPGRRRGPGSARPTRGRTPGPGRASSPCSPPAPAQTFSPASGSISARSTSTRQRRRQTLRGPGEQPATCWLL